MGFLLIIYWSDISQLHHTSDCSLCMLSWAFLSWEPRRKGVCKGKSTRTHARTHSSSSSLPCPPCESTVWSNPYSVPLINYLWCEELYLLCLEITVITFMLRNAPLPFLQHLIFFLHLQISPFSPYTGLYNERWPKTAHFLFPPPPQTNQQVELFPVPVVFWVVLLYSCGYPCLSN